jgi:glycosyltransferase involved in cell wall biosynthesis
MVLAVGKASINMKIVINEGLSTLRKGSGIGEHSQWLYHSLRQYAQECNGELDVELTDYSAWRRFPPRLQRLLYLAWTNTVSAMWHGLRKVDLVHYTNYYLPVLRHPNIEYVVTIHDLTPYVAPDTLPKSYVQYARRAIQYAVNGADVIIADTEAIQKEISQNLGTGLDKIQVCYSGVRPIFRRCQELPHASRKEILRCTQNDIGEFFLFVGTLERRKNLVTLIRALARLRKKDKLGHLRLVLVGRQGFGFAEIEQAIHQEGLDDVVSLTGYIPDDQLVNLYNAALALIMPSEYEGFGIPLLEAMACQVPIIASDIPAFREVAGQAALFYGAPKDVDSLLSAMETVIHDRALRQNLIEAGRLQVHNFSWERVAQQHIEAYKKTLAIVS